jgi:hypothetical protein
VSTQPGAPGSDGFDAVVASWRDEGGVPQWPDFDGPPAAAGGCTRGAVGGRPVDEDHFVPGEPPPLPRLAAPILVGLVLLALGLALVTVPTMIGVPSVYGLPLGLVALAAGLGWLVLRLWPDPADAPPPIGHDPDDPDEGAVL